MFPRTYDVLALNTLQHKVSTHAKPYNEIATGSVQLWDPWGIKRRDFDKMAVTSVPEAAEIFEAVFTNQKFQNLFKNLYDEANGDVDVIKADLSNPQIHQQRLILLRKLCNAIGLANSHDTVTIVKDAVLEANKEALQKCLQGLADLRCKNKRGSRKRNENKNATDVEWAQKCRSDIRMVFREFSGHILQSVAKRICGRKVYQSRLVLLPDLGLVRHMITAVTPAVPQASDEEMDAELDEILNASFEEQGV